MSRLEKRRLGRTGLEATVLGFGAMDLGGPPVTNVITDDEAGRVLNAVLDSGINYIDTSIDYNVSEARIGQAISHRRKEFFLATKCGCVPGKPMGTGHVNTAANIRAGVEHSLRTMKTDYIDVVQFHESLTRSAWEADGGLDELRKMKKEGKLHFIGVSGTLPNLAEQIKSGVFDVFQIPYSALQREHEDMISKASEAGAGIVIRGGVARGAPSDWDRRYYMLTKDEMSSRWDKARLDELLDGMSRIEFMVRFVISNPDLDTTIIGTKDLEHLRANLEAAMKGPLPEDVVTEAKRRLDLTGSRPVKTEK